MGKKYILIIFDHFIVNLNLVRLLTTYKNKNAMELIDPRSGSNHNKLKAARMMKVLLLYTNSLPALSPANMSSVASTLKRNV